MCLRTRVVVRDQWWGSPCDTSATSSIVRGNLSLRQAVQVGRRNALRGRTTQAEFELSSGIVYSKTVNKDDEQFYCDHSNEGIEYECKTDSQYKYGGSYE